MNPSIFEYNDGAGVMPEGHVRAGASQISRFFTNTSQWYREVLLNEEGFTGNTSSYLGTIVHAIAETVGKNEDMSNAVEVIESFIDSIDNPDVDKAVIRANYKPMAEELVNTYLSTNTPTNAEDFLYKEIFPSVGVGGSCDAAIFAPDNKSGVIVDYKTTGLMTAPKEISYGYRLQLLTYAWLYKELKGQTADRIRIVYVTRNNVGRISPKTGKPLQDYPSKCTVITEQITEEDYDYIESIIHIVSESMCVWQTKPELRHLLSQDMRLKV